MRIFYLLAAFCFSSLVSPSQGTSGNSGTGANIDVDNYQIYWRINPDSLKGIKGEVKIKFKTTTPNVSSIILDLSSTLAITSVQFRGANVTPTRSGNTFTVPLGTVINASGTRDSITVAYNGVPPAAGGGRIGYQKTSDAGAGNYIYTLAESYEDRDFWPCKADMQDKADTIDITVNVPWRTKVNNAANATDTFWVASNGTLVDSTFDIAISPRELRNATFKFQNRYPMATYLVSVCVAPFRRFYRGTQSVGGENVPVVYYLFPGKADYNPILAAMDKTTELVAAYGQKFGDYAFNNPLKGGKHGFYEGLANFGGMEHQTFSAISTNSLTNRKLLAHELAHQWFGNKVTFGTWNHLWLAEGFAEYLVALAPELVSGMGYTAYDERLLLKNKALTQKASIFIPNSNISNSDQIWAGATNETQYNGSVYDRGAMVVSMLRTISGDEKFFNVLKDFQTSPTLAYKTATTDTLKKRFADTLGINLDEFFNDNVMGTGYPDYNIGYQKFGPGSKSVAFSVAGQNQLNGDPAGAPASTVAYFNNPIVVHMKGNSLPAEDTTVVFYDWGAGVLSKAGNGVGPQISGNTLTYNLSFMPVLFAFDDSARTMAKGTMTELSILDLKLLDFKVKQHPTYNDATITLDDNTINSLIILERSANGKDFEDIGTMVLQGSAGISKKYLFIDVKPLETDNYYRAKYKNAEGVFMYSKIIKVGSVKSYSFSILNNPVQDVVQVRTEAAVGKDMTLTIYDALGRMMKSKIVKNVGSNAEISVVGLQTGVYILKIRIANEEVQNLKFLKK